MNDEKRDIDPLSDGEEEPEASGEELPTMTLVFALIVMLLPAGIPIYFALRLGGTLAIWLFALAAVIAVVNTILVIVLWNWINTLRTSS